MADEKINVEIDGKEYDLFDLVEDLQEEERLRKEKDLEEEILDKENE